MGPLSDSVPTVGVVPEVTIVDGIMDSIVDGADVGLHTSTILQFLTSSDVASQHSLEVSNISASSIVVLG